MNDDWKPGDLGVCVDDSPCPVYPDSNGGIKLHGFYNIIEVRSLQDKFGRWEVGLRLDRHNPVHPRTGATGFHNACRLRKIHPHTPDEQDEETIRLLKGEGVPA